MDKGAIISECGNYRYSLWRIWTDTGFKSRLLVFVGLNPSTADATEDDATIRRCVGFAKCWGYEGIVMLNLFAFRATNPKVMAKEPQKVGPKNDYFLNMWSHDKEFDVVFCWGNFPQYHWRINQVKRIFPHGKPIALTKDGMPRHPLYLRASINNPHQRKENPL